MRAALLAIALAGACGYEHEFKPVDAGSGRPNVYFTEGVGLDITEGTTGTIHAHLSGATPTHDVTVDIVSADPALIQVDTPTILFPVASWRDVLIVHVTALQDADAVNDLAHLDFTGPDVIANRFQLDITDDDVQAILPASTVVDVDEGSMTSLAVRLAAQPLSTVAVDVLSDAQDPVAPTTLTFDPTSWLVPQTLMISSVHDTNTTSEDTTLVLSAPGMATVHVTIHNHDTGP